MRFTTGVFLAVGVAAVLLTSALAFRTAADGAAGTSVQILFDLGDGTYAWSLRVSISDPDAPNATWNATSVAAAEAGISLESSWYSCCGVFVNGLGGRRPPTGTGLFVWNGSRYSWDLAPAGLSSLVLQGNATIALSNSAFDSVTYATRAPVPTPDHPFPVTQFRGDLENRGIAPTPGPKTSRTLWDHALPLQEIEATPAVGRGLVFVNTLDGFYALDVRTGDVSWENLAVKGLSSPALVGETVLVGGSDGRVHALNATSGEERWNTTLVEHPMFSGITSSPKVEYDFAYVGTFNESGGPGDVVALWISNGSIAWRHATASVDFSSPAVFDGSVYVGVMGHYNTTTQVTWDPPFGVLALEAASGNEEWFFPTNASVAASPVVHGDLLLVPAKNGFVYALNRTHGTPVWSRDVRAGVSSPALDGDTLLVGGGSFGEGGVLVAVDVASGVPRWTSSANGPIQSSLTVADGIVYFATNTAGGTIYAVNTTTGALVWSYTPSPAQFIFGSPVVADGRLYAVSDNGHVYAFLDSPAEPDRLGQTSFQPVVLGAVALVAVAAAVAVFWFRRSRHGP
ncbi:MAG TPA: PQQ-binding-like beta-propeller repeat protein [Thermoplasmata archaeon]|nr:PQQ-binding-like beta-propeller repeat protein [Thermoplasmata archaeon]